MSAPDWSRIRHAFHEALERPLSARRAWLASAFPDEPDLRREVLSLLDAWDEDPDFLEAPVGRVPGAGEAPHAEEASATDPLVGARIAAFEIVERLGAGGMGVVYRASRTEGYRQEVALKVVKRGMDSEHVLQRFRAERQILASLDHPSIARLLDGGMSEDGRPYFALELVDGATPIDVWCRERALPPAERVRLFRSVCSAVHYAHRNLVVHRDLKPSNVLVSAEGRVKLVDFGIAKLLDPVASGATAARTLTGMRVLTPEYASPEQREGGVITTASDVWALGVLLHEVLTGERPAPAPTPAPGPPRTDGRLDRELATVVRMAMREEPERRYPSAEALDEDLGRYLANLPLRARPDTATYRVRKFLRRHRAPAALASTLAVTVAGFVVHSAIQSARIARTAEVAVRERDAAAAVASFLIDVFEVADPTAASDRDVTARELLERGSQRLAADRELDPALKARLGRVIAEVSANLGEYESAHGQLEGALRALEALPDADPEETLRTTTLAGVTLHRLARWEEADSRLREAIAFGEERLGSGHPLVASARYRRGDLLADRGELDEAIAELRLAAASAVRGGAGVEPEERAEILASLGQALRMADELEEAERLLEEALSIRRTLPVARPAAVAASLDGLGSLRRARGRPAEAESLFVEALRIRCEVYGEQHPVALSSLGNLAGALKDQGEYERADSLYARGLEFAESESGPDSPQTIQFLNNRSVVQIYRQDYEGARETLEKLLPRVERVLGPDHASTAGVLNNLAHAVGELGDYPAAEAAYRRVLDIERGIYGEEHSAVAMTLSSLSTCLRVSGRMDEAETVARQALAMRRRVLPPDHGDLGNSFFGLAVIRMDRDPEESEALLVEAERIFGARFEPHDWRNLQVQEWLGIAEGRQGRPEDAEARLGVALARAREHHGEEGWITKKIVDALADIRADHRADAAADPAADR